MKWPGSGLWCFWCVQVCILNQLLLKILLKSYFAKIVTYAEERSQAKMVALSEAERIVELLIERSLDVVWTLHCTSWQISLLQCSIGSNGCIWFCSANWTSHITKLVGGELERVIKFGHLEGKLWDCQFPWPNSLGRAMFYFLNHSVAKINVCGTFLLLYVCL